jgi:hypothetical protein
MNNQQFDARLKFTCPSCGGRWKVKVDAMLCHGVEPCTKEADCAAASHFGDCKSMPSSEAHRTTRRELNTKLLKDIDNLSIDNGYSPEFLNGFHRGVLAARTAVKKALRESDTQRAYWRQKQSESRQRRARSERQR